MDKRKLGAYGENLAAEFLIAEGYAIVGMNYRTRQGEIDVIARDGEYIVFAEVKLRRDGYRAAAMEYVTKSKQAKIIAVAESWLQQNETTLQPRFDVIEIYAAAGEKTRKPRINHIINAF